MRLIAFLFFIPQVIFAQFEELNFESIPPKIESESVYRAVTYDDELGCHIIVFKMDSAGNYFTPSWKSSIKVESYLKKDKSYDLEWDIKDFSQNPYSKVIILDSTFCLVDTDTDGILESLFIYLITPDGMDPAEIKMMMHHRSDKLAIRGILPKSFEDLGAYKKNVDPAFDKKNVVLKDYASDYWDAFVTKYQKRYY